MQKRLQHGKHNKNYLQKLCMRRKLYLVNVFNIHHYEIGSKQLGVKSSKSKSTLKTQKWRREKKEATEESRKENTREKIFADFRREGVSNREQKIGVFQLLKQTRPTTTNDYNKWLRVHTLVE